jgi:hypothetical protein
VNTELEDKVIVVCAGCEWRAEAPSLAEAFQKIREKPEPKDGAP